MDSNRDALFQALSSEQGREGLGGKERGRQGPRAHKGTPDDLCFPNSWVLLHFRVCLKLETFCGIFTSWENLFSCLIKRLVVTLAECLRSYIHPSLTTGRALEVTHP